LQDVFLEYLLSELSAFGGRLERGGRLVDIGCGTGRLLCRLCARFPTLQGVGVDLDADAIDLARERAAREGLADRATFDVRDAVDVEVPFDAAVLFMSVHEIPPENRQALFERLGDALTTDGVVVVFDEVYPDRYDRFDQSPFAAGVETQWAELTWGADVPTDAEHSALLAAADCTERHNRTIADRFTVYEGIKT
jgi:cyclopropane fatty-acyl-phospholipid synthase-like methyltransferase